MLKPIRISGIPDKFQPVKDMIRALANTQANRNSPLKEELERLQQLAQQEPHYWHDRERLLLIVNSYDQAEWAYKELKLSEQGHTALPGEIRYLVRANTDSNEVVTYHLRKVG